MATLKSKLDLSSIGWEYCEVRGKRFSDLLAVRLRLRPNLTKGVKIASADKSALTKLGFVLVGSELERVTPSSHGTVALTKREISMVFKEFDSETMVVAGERNTFEPRGEFISYSTHQTVSVPQAMLAIDHQTGIAAGRLEEKAFNELIKARTVELSNLRRLHALLDPDGKFGETAVFHVIQKIRDSLNAQIDATDEIALFSVDGKTFNPPLRIIYDDSASKPSVFADLQAYRKNLKVDQETQEVSRPSSIHDEVARGIFQKAKDASESFSKDHSASSIEGPPADLPAPMKSAAPIRPLSDRPFVVPKSPPKALPSFASKHASGMDPIAVAKADESIKKMYGGEMERRAPEIQETRFSVQQQASASRPVMGGQPLSITDFLKEQSLLKLSFKAVLKKIPELFAQYASENPQVDEPFFNRATRMFIREESLRIMAGIASKQPTQVARDEPSTKPASKAVEIEDDDLFEVGSFEIGGEVATTERVSSKHSAASQLPSWQTAPTQKPAAVDDFSQFEKPAISVDSTPSGTSSAPAHVSRPGGGFMSKLKGSVESSASAPQKDANSPESTSEPASGRGQSMSQNKSSLEFSSVLRKPSSLKPLPNFNR